MTSTNSTPPFNRITGLIVIEVRNSNPNGDPDMESDPRTLEADGRGVISAVSFKRKLRDLVADKGPVWQEWSQSVTWKKGQSDWIDDSDYQYEILESRGRDRDQIKKLSAHDFARRFWDARVFGNTFLESMKDDKAAKKLGSHFISTGVIQVGVGISAARIEIDRSTQTNKAGVEEGKDRGMAPLGDRRVRHAVYAIPFFVNPAMAAKTEMTARDLDLFRFLLPYSYAHTASAIRPFISVLHAWWVEHRNPLGSCPDALLIDALSPRRKGDRR
jgi:CRISPR-associated protein Csd2